MTDPEYLAGLGQLYPLVCDRLSLVSGWPKDLTTSIFIQNLVQREKDILPSDNTKEEKKGVVERALKALGIKITENNHPPERDEPRSPLSNLSKPKSFIAPVYTSLESHSLATMAEKVQTARLAAEKAQEPSALVSQEIFLLYTTYFIVITMNTREAGYQPFSPTTAQHDADNSETIEKRELMFFGKLVISAMERAEGLTFNMSANSISAPNSNRSRFYQSNPEEPKEMSSLCSCVIQ